MHRLDPVEELGGGPIEVKETHISLVLLGARRVLKLKKPVDFGFLDYSTLEKRKSACQAEVRLNSRISPEMYIGVQPIRDEDGVPHLRFDGPVIDYGVLMNRLPADRMLDEMVRRGTVTTSIIDRLAGRLAGFHRTAHRGPEVDVFGSVSTVAGNWDENFEQTEPFVGRTIDEATLAAIRGWVHERLVADRTNFVRRVAEGRIVDGHGDVRCESVCLVNGVTIFDCIEFNERFRCGDAAAEIAFLAMDLDALGRPDLGYYAAERYQLYTGDPGLWRLLPFYRCYRAFVRGKVLSFRLDQPGVTAEERDRAAARATAFFELARRYASRLVQPAVVLVAGRSGTGKTSLARAMASELGLRVVSTDSVRAELFGERKGPAEFGQGVYTEAASDHTYRTLIARAEQIRGQNGSVILDGTFLKERYRAMAAEMAQRTGSQLRVVECRLEPEQARERLRRRALHDDGLSDATWETHLRQQREPPHSHAGHSWLTLDTAPSIAACSRTGADWLRQLARAG